MKLETQGLAGQIAKEILALSQSLKKPFGKLPEAEQQAHIEQSEKLAKDLVDGATDLVLSQGGGTLDVIIHNVTGKKDTTQATISCDRDEPLSEHLFKHRHQPGKLVFSNVGPEINSLGDRVKPDPDQPAMFSDDADPLFHPDGRVNDPDDKPVDVDGAYEKVGETESGREVLAMAEKAKPGPKPRKSPTKSKAAAKGAPRKRTKPAAPKMMDLASDG